MVTPLKYNICCAKPVQSLNAFAPIVVTVLGIVKVPVKLHPANTESPIDVTGLFIVKVSLKPLQP